MINLELQPARERRETLRKLPTLRSHGIVAHRQQLNTRPQRYARFIMTKHSSSCAQHLLAHDTCAETLQHRHKTMQDLYILRLMVSNDTTLDMTVAIIIVTRSVNLPGCMHRSDRSRDQERSIAKFTATHDDFELHGRFK